MKKADLIKRIEKLEQLRAEVAETTTGQDTDGTPARSEPEPTSAIPESKETTSSAPNAQHGNNGNGDAMPESLHGISKMDIHLHFTDGQMDQNEIDWYSKKCMTRMLMKAPVNSWML